MNLLYSDKLFFKVWPVKSRTRNLFFLSLRFTAQVSLYLFESLSPLTRWFLEEKLTEVATENTVTEMAFSFWKKETTKASF